MGSVVGSKYIFDDPAVKTTVVVHQDDGEIALKVTLHRAAFLGTANTHFFNFPAVGKHGGVMDDALVATRIDVEAVINSRAYGQSLCWSITCQRVAGMMDEKQGDDHDTKTIGHSKNFV